MKIIGVLLLSLMLFSCGVNSPDQSENINERCVNPNAAFFYPICDSARFYVYRNVSNGLDEEFHRVYKVSDSQGAHVIVERYASDGRLLEALNYNLDSLDLMDHMVVNYKNEKEQSILYKNTLFPFNLQEEAYFSSKFRGVNDSTLILKEIKRKFNARGNIEYLNKMTETIIFKDYIRLTSLNVVEHKEEERLGEEMAYFAKGIGLVEWHSPTKSTHFKLEKIISQKEWVKMMQK